jgi:hypothetical protein
MTDFGDIIPAIWKSQELTTANWSTFEQDVLMSAVLKLTNEFEYGFMGFILSDADWALLPGNTDNVGVIKVPPAVPGMPQEPAPSDASAADDRRFDRELKIMIRIKEVRKEIVEVSRRFKEALLNQDIIGELGFAGKDGGHT